MPIVLGPLSRRLSAPTIERVGALFAVVFVVNGLVNLIEAVYFTSILDGGVAGTVAVIALSAAGLAALIGLLFPPAHAERRRGAALGELFASRGPLPWVWRIGLAGLLYLPVYFLFGNIAYPFVRQYYEDPSFGFGLRVPGVEVIVPLELVRGLLYVLSVLPLVALLGGSRWRLVFWLGLAIAALNSWEPLLTNFVWPSTLRLTHGLEITADAVAQGITIAWVVGLPRAAQRKREG